MNGLVELHREWPMLSSIIEQIPIQKLALIEHLCLLVNEGDDQSYIHLSELLPNHYQVNIDHYTLRLLSKMFGKTLPNFHTPGNHVEIINSFSLNNNTSFFSTIYLSSCYTKCILCNNTLNKYVHQSVCVYHDNGECLHGVIKIITCTHRHTTYHNDPPIYYLPNYICQPNNIGKCKRIFQISDFFYNDKYIYMGGKTAFERNLLIRYLVDLYDGGKTVHAYVQSYNHRQSWAYGHRSLNELLFYRYVISFALIHYYFWMGYEKVIFPKNVKGDQLENFFYQSHENVKQCFIRFWGRHNVFLPCENNCSKLVNADGNWKFGRRICMDKSKIRSTPEFDSVLIGCDKTPKPGKDYCDEHDDRRDTEVINEEEDDDIDLEGFIRLRNGKQIMRYQSLTCNTKKNLPMKYASVCHRSFGITVYFTNCGVCLAINEIYRSETIKEILMGWFDIISATSTNIKSALQDEVANTPLPQVVFNPVVAANNTQSCEQANSVLKKYVNQFNRMNEERSLLMLYFLMHGRNCIAKKLNPFERGVATNQ
ncbi:unnamed protein product, partial [Rotaria sp. Silwood2]